jgi:hypothetical protein
MGTIILNMLTFIQKLKIYNFFLPIMMTKKKTINHDMDINNETKAYDKKQKDLVIFLK